MTDNKDTPATSATQQGCSMPDRIWINEEYFSGLYSKGPTMSGSGLDTEYTRAVVTKDEAKRALSDFECNTTKSAIRPEFYHSKGISRETVETIRKLVEAAAK